ncbi:uncharacterized protein LOC120006921 isoform X2 [Tripterygium wilfordii]|uniref:uncharacterized protein LOC120006921 isoform X2 n=1 Tax=Tripterygium wilfordii TaxID=458696 RepID=UPI0018F7EE1B|nr:uncharacterized protein LOC120006921 isoform X2 [Tripterygium wilfordii]
MASHLSLISVFFLFGLTLPSLSLSVPAKLLLEEGYTVTTVMNGHKLNINPYAILPRPGSSDFLVLDSSGSSIYTVSFQSSPDGVVVNRLSGDRAHVADYQDGELGSAWFNHPRSFAVDLKGNVYVADKNNMVIRKITNTGVTTIAGGYSRKEGHDDGPAQNATFSNAFDLFFIPEMCALLISDHGNLLVRRIDLKPEDCKRTSKSALGAAAGWVLGLGLSCLFGILVGIVLRPYIIPSEGHSLCSFSKTWKHCLISLERKLLTLFCGSRNAIASFVLYVPLMQKLFWLCVSHLSLMFKINNVQSRTSNREVISLLDCDVPGHTEIRNPPMYTEQLKVSFSSDGILEHSSSINEIIFKQREENQETGDVSSDHHERLDAMIQANFMGFTAMDKETTPLDCSSVGNSGLVKRR